MSGPWPVVAIVALLLTSLNLMSAATQNSADFGRLYVALLVVNVLALLLLGLLILRHLVRVITAYRINVPGSRLTARLVAMFVALSLAPVSVVFYFSLEFLERGIDSWFDVRVERALEDALELGRTALDSTVQEQLRASRRMAGQLRGLPEASAEQRLDTLRDGSQATSLLLVSANGHFIAGSGTASSLPDNVPLQPAQEYAVAEPLGAGRMQVRVILPVAGERNAPRLLQAIYPVPERLASLAEGVQTAYARYQELSYLRQPLKRSFTLTLSIVLLLSVLGAVWAAFFSARRLVEPIRDLAEGTRAVAAGDYDKRLPLPGRDELGFLVRSFNEMTRKLSLSRDQARRSQSQVETQRAYLETVLERLSSGVLTARQDGSLHTANTAAGQILALAPEEIVGHTLTELAKVHTRLEPFVSAVQPLLHERNREWRAEVTLFGQGGRQVLICRGSSLPDAAMRGGHVIVFDDVTALIQAQRDAAWGEVARRLAHEIKNPLTPIQLSAERLRHKYLQRMSPEDADVLDRSTHTIVQQVESLKEMVKAFSEYAHTPTLRLQPVELDRVINEVLDLYRGDRKLHIQYHAAATLPVIDADMGRVRQLLHNLIKNALEAGAGRESPIALSIATRCGSDHCDFVELCVADDGPGFPEELLGRLFEPYVTTKPKGTGLGLAIVKKIVEEHGGMLTASNRPEGGAKITVRLPAGKQHEAVAAQSNGKA
jgi:PAS domain S-box-containing protein